MAATAAALVLSAPCSHAKIRHVQLQQCNSGAWLTSGCLPVWLPGFESETTVEQWSSGAVVSSIATTRSTDWQLRLTNVRSRIKLSTGQLAVE
jgi:hypothetical protein